MTVENRVRSALREVGAGVVPPVPDPARYAASGTRVRRRRRLAAVVGMLVVGLLAVGVPRMNLLPDQGEVTKHLDLPGRLSDLRSYDYIAPGPYVADFLGAPTWFPRVVVTVPPGFSTDGWLYDALGDGPESSASGLAHRQLAFWTVDAVNTNACRGADHWVSAGTTAQDLLTALRHVPSLRLGDARPITLDGYPGWRVRLSQPAAQVWDACALATLNVWRSADLGVLYQRNVSRPEAWVHDLWIVDVGRYRVVLDAEHLPGVSADQLAELEDIVATAVFVPFGSTPGTTQGP
ncbi:hypothetical protein FB382_000069 [Nocardioides ginsengisegetis]|uniref:Uncharacterized protein n=1 Tax=Nocardioides ginsengisegetis TaxID=661491 RepID=A0A7W3P7U9_9ACTN|nr:hypothetical protein [Nocardioides ginsengisegetis]MBA8801778.1 hypothetical protein [Nocardioides ginsengisegetis]